MTAEVKQVKPHIILHFDINGTLYMADPGNHEKTLHDVICTYIATQHFALWDDSLDKPISFFNYVREHLLPNPNYDSQIKASQNNIYSKILAEFKTRNYTRFSEAEKDYNRAIAAQKKQEAKGTFIVPSLFKLVKHLRKNDISFTLLLRSFGNDAEKISDELAKTDSECKIHEFRSLNGDGSLEIDGKIKNLYEYIIETGVEGKKNLSIQGTYSRWIKSGCKSEYGKPFPIDSSDRKHLSLIFDDCAEHNPDRPDENIIHLYDEGAGKSLSTKDGIDEKLVFPVNSIEALCDKNYFVNLVTIALERFAKAG